jgi:hypothetical protein
MSWVLASVVVQACGLEIAGLAPTSSTDGGSASGSSGSSGARDGDLDDGSSVIDSADASDGSAVSDGSEDAPVVVPDFAWYRLDETSGNTANDSTPNNYDITNLQNVTWGSGATFNGTSSQGSTTVAASLRQAPVSFTAWIVPIARADRNANQFSIVPFPTNAVSGDVAGSFGYGIGLNVWTDGTPGSALGVENVGYSFTNNGAQFVSGTEYFVAAAIGATTAQIYVNALLVGTMNATAPAAAATTTLRLGVHNGDTNYETKRFFKGRLRDVRIFKRVLTAAEVAQLYAAGPVK